MKKATKNLLTFFLLMGATLAQDAPESAPAAAKPAKMEVLSDEALEKLLNTRLDGGIQFSFRQFSNMFLVSSHIHFGTGIGLMTESQAIAETELQPIYPEGYRPTLREFLDRIAQQTSASWSYDPSGKFISDETGEDNPVQNMAIFEFKQRDPVVRPYKITLEEGWKTEDHGHWVMHVPEVFPIGMDVYQMGAYTPEKGELTPEFIKQTCTDISMTWAQRVRPESKVEELVAAKVGKQDALYFECLTPSQFGQDIKWRQWVFFLDNEAYFIVSTIFPDFEERIFPDVKKMIASFEKRGE